MNDNQIKIIYHYRFLEEISENGSYIRTLGLAYDECEETDTEINIASFIYGRLEHIYSLANSIDKLENSDIIPEFAEHNCKWGDIQTIIIPDYENSDWTIDEPFLERRRQDNRVKDSSRKVA
ncbi:MAG: hypothetical protein LWY06_07990 [Firmicutes bacterium]|nr:hypothetical protein [Bacillota bacterium]